MRLVTISALLSIAVSQAAISAEMEEQWTLELNNSCNKFELSLPLPALNATCDLDQSSGNPSKWFNPFETCNLDFDMIGLPSLGDIAAGIAGQVCDAIKEVKADTLDKVIDDINESIPDKVFDDIDLEKDFTDDINNIVDPSGGSSNGNSDWKDDNEAQPNEDKNVCYTTDAAGATITVPCDIAKEGENDDACYLKSDSYSQPFTPISCSRFTPENEMCITEWITDAEERKKIPQLGACTTGLRQSKAEACFDANSEPMYCSSITTHPVTQQDRMCRFTIEDGDGRTIQAVDSCYKIERACYGHLNGAFQATTCQALHDQYFQNRGFNDVYEQFW